MNKQALALVKKLNVTPEDNDTSRSLLKQADEKHSELAKFRGAAFDRAYADNEVAYHKTVNGRWKPLLYLRQATPSLRVCSRLASRSFRATCSMPNKSPQTCRLPGQAAADPE